MYFKEFNSLKGIAILLVLLGHSFILYPINLLDISWCKSTFDVIYSFHMPLFFIISGLLFANSTHKEYASMMKGKVKRLLLPYAFYHALNLGLKVALPNLVNRKVDSWTEYGDSILLRGGVVVSVCLILAFFDMGIYFAPNM